MIRLKPILIAGLVLFGTTVLAPNIALGISIEGLNLKSDPANGNLISTVEGLTTDSCIVIEGLNLDLNAKQSKPEVIILQLHASSREDFTPCRAVVSAFSQSVDLGSISPGTYEVVVANRGLDLFRHSVTIQNDTEPLWLNLFII